MNAHEIIDRIRRLDIPKKAKAELLAFWHRARHIVERIISYLENHREFAQSLLLGSIVAFLLAQIPWLGGFLALCALITFTAIGIMHQMRSDLEYLFA